MKIDKKSLFFMSAGIVLAGLAVYSTLLSIRGEEDLWDFLDRYRSENFFSFRGKWTADDGRMLEFSNFKGNHLIVSFVYLECSVSCPLIVQKMKLLEKGGDLPSSLKMIIIILDDLTENPSALIEYKKRYGINHDRWVLLTSDYDTLDSIAGSYRIYYQKSNAVNFNFTHSNRILFVDPEGNIKKNIRNLADFRDSELRTWIQKEFVISP
ncbi:MAG: SCO family protein [Spirochaetia bacterium]|nr:SCO family protein [Spirochaetia bacterium]